MLLWILDWLQCAADWGRPQHSTCAPEKNQAAYYFLFYFLIFSKHETLKTLHRACILWQIKSEVSCKGTIHKPFCSHTVHLRCKKLDVLRTYFQFGWLKYRHLPGPMTWQYHCLLWWSLQKYSFVLSGCQNASNWAVSKGVLCTVCGCVFGYLDSLWNIPEHPPCNDV